MSGKPAARQGDMTRRKDHQKFTFVLNNSHFMFKN